MGGEFVTTVRQRGDMIFDGFQNEVVFSEIVGVI